MQSVMHQTHNIKHGERHHYVPYQTSINDKSVTYSEVNEASQTKLAGHTLVVIGIELFLVKTFSATEVI